jgi:Ca2+-binding RTX toxin-like protein
MPTIDFSNAGSFTTSAFNQPGIRITGSNTLTFANLNGFGITGGTSNLQVDPGESFTISFTDGLATGVVLNTNSMTDSNANGAFGECLVEAFDSNRVSLGIVVTNVNGFSANISNLFGNQPISAFRVQASEAFRPNRVTFSVPTVNITAVSPTLGEADTTPGKFRISRSDTTGNLVVNLAIDGSSTLSPADYQLSGGSLATSGSNLSVTIPAGVDFVELNVTPVDDSRAEATENLKLNLAKGNYIQGSSNSATIALTDNDTAKISLGVLNSSLSETGSTSIIAYSSIAAETDIVVNLAFSGSAARGTDYTTPNATILIPAGSTTGILDLTGIDDTISEASKTIAIDIASISSSAAAQENGTQQATITLLDNDTVPPISPTNPAVSPISPTPGSGGRTAIAPTPINFGGAKGRTLRGTAATNNLTGTAKNDILRGLGGNDRLKGLGGNDRMDGGTGNDRMDGGSGNDQLTGGDGVDTLLGGNGNDVLLGGIGADSLTGGAGADLFVFNSLSEAGDTITDFAAAEDLIDLRAIFAASAFGGGSPFARFTQFVQLVQVGTNTQVRIDADGNGAGTNFVTLATLQNVGVGAIGSQNFVVG